jgi:hypothetical protein
VKRSLAVLLVVAACPSVAHAHAFDPFRLDVVATGGGRYDLVLKIARTGETGESGESTEPSPITIDLPSRCRETNAPIDEPVRGAVLRSWSVDCGHDGLAGTTLAVHSDDDGPFEVVVRYRERDAELFVALLTTRSPSIVLPASSTSASALDLSSRYFELGVRHILTGLDHLLFVTCLLLLTRGRALFASITAFTLGHCVTLALAALGVVSVPSAPVEACIAASVVLLAAERLRLADSAPERSMTLRAAVPAVFGLLHGLGFAGALSEVGLPHGQIPLALAMFNFGVELGQLAFVTVALALLAVMQRATSSDASVRPIALAAGVVAAWWTGERLAACVG